MTSQTQDSKQMIKNVVIHLFVWLLWLSHNVTRILAGVMPIERSVQLHGELRVKCQIRYLLVNNPKIVVMKC